MPYGRVEWFDGEGNRHAVNTFDKAEHAAVCRSLRRRGRTIRKATQISRLA